MIFWEPFSMFVTEVRPRPIRTAKAACVMPMASRRRRTALPSEWYTSAVT